MAFKRRAPDRVLRLALLACLVLQVACVSQVRLTPEEITAASSPASRDTTIALLGGTGMAGGYILREALKLGYGLRVLSRSPEKLAYLGRRIVVVEGDARDPLVIARLLEGSDVVISAIGPVKTDGPGADRISTTVTGNVLSAMDVQGGRRYIVVSGAGVEMPGDQRNFTGWLMRQLVRLRYPKVLDDKQAEFALLARSDVPWTLVRCPLIESADFQRQPGISLATPSSFNLRAGELASSILHLLEEGGFEREGPFVYSH